MKPRGILPTYVTDEQVILCKAAPTIRNAYEIRLALFMAFKTKRKFILIVSPLSTVDQGLETHIRQHGGEVVRDMIKEHSVYVGITTHAGAEGDGWVAGDNQMWESVLNGLQSTWLRTRLRVGSIISPSLLHEFRQHLAVEDLRATNVDEEDIYMALLKLAAEAIQVGGTIFIQ